MRGHWQQTQFGQMFDDEIMQPFVDDLRKQLQGKFSLVTDKLGITWVDLKGISAGEVSLALIDRGERPAALAVTFDVTDRAAQANKLLAAVEQRFTARRGARRRKTSAARRCMCSRFPPMERMPSRRRLFTLSKTTYYAGLTTLPRPKRCWAASRAGRKTTCNP